MTFLDITRLANDPSPGVRSELAGKISQAIQQDGFKDSETKIAEDILRILARDLEVQVRRSVALALCNVVKVPQDLLMRLANDVADVATPVLQFSKLLSDKDLIQIVEQAEEVMKLVAIAKREQVSDAVSSALIKSSDEKVIYTLFRNEGAEISDATFQREWNAFSENQSLVDTLVQRGNLSVLIAEKLYSMVSNELKRHLVSKHKLPIALVEDAVEEHKEWKTLDVLSANTSKTADTNEERNNEERNVESLVHQLYTSNRLTYSIIIRSLCNGDIDFFEAALSRLAGVPRANARILIYDSGTLGFRAFYEKAKMPGAFYEAIRTILRLSLEIRATDNKSTEEFRHCLVQRIQDEGYDYTIENMHYLLSLVMNNIGINASGTFH